MRFCESRYGKGRNRMVENTLNIAVLNPIPNVRARIATTVKPGLR
jgi:hypothetical protein